MIGVFTSPAFSSLREPLSWRRRRVRIGTHALDNDADQFHRSDGETAAIVLRRYPRDLLHDILPFHYLAEDGVAAVVGRNFGATVINDWQPPVFGAPIFAMARRPGSSNFSVGTISSLILMPQSWLLVPVGSPA